MSDELTKVLESPMTYYKKKHENFVKGYFFFHIFMCCTKDLECT